MKTDQHLWEEFRSCNNYALGELYKRHYETLITRILYFTQNKELAENYLHDVILSLLERDKSTLPLSMHFVPFVVKSARNCWLREIRQKNRQEQRLKELMEFMKEEIINYTPWENQDGILARLEEMDLYKLHSLIEACLQAWEATKKSNKVRDAKILRYFFLDGLKIGEICETIGLEVDNRYKGHIRNYKCRALPKLIQSLVEKVR